MQDTIRIFNIPLFHSCITRYHLRYIISIGLNNTLIVTAIVITIIPLPLVFRFTNRLWGITNIARWYLQLLSLLPHQMHVFVWYMNHLLYLDLDVVSCLHCQKIGEDIWIINSMFRCVISHDGPVQWSLCKGKPPV